ncbi:MAG: hypothetical protein ABFR62_11130 [Bacteroidota bacterium]
MNKIFINTIILSFISISLYSQEEKKEELGTEVVNVVKAYNPEVSDAYKIKLTPENNIGETKKQKLSYETYTTDVASTFKPSKIGAKSQVREKIEKPFDNYLILGYGSYRTPLLELYMNNKKVKEQRYGIHVQHLSSEGGIEGVKFNNAFINSSIDGFYWKQFKNHQLKTSLNYNYQSINWFGVPKEFISNEIINDLNVGQNYKTIEGNISFVNNGKKGNAIFNSSSLKAYRMTDRYNSHENRVKADGVFSIPIEDHKIKIITEIDFVDSYFNEGIYLKDEIKNKYLNFTLNPSYNFVVENATLNLGIGVYYSADLIGDNNLLRFYPKADVSVNIINDLMIAYGGVDGALRQNSLQSIVNEMPYVSPTQTISPTNMRYKYYAGLRGKLASNITYNTNASFRNEYGFLNYIYNPAKLSVGDLTPPVLATDAKGWEAANSFSAIQDSVKIFELNAGIEYEAIKDLLLSANFRYNIYGSKKFEDVYNRPSLMLSATIEYRFLENFTLGTQMYYVGSRNYAQHSSNILSSFEGTAPHIVTKTGGQLDPYFDLNFNAGYDISKKFSAFLKLNNILNKNYELYKNYPVQGLQIMAGVGYRF